MKVKIAYKEDPGEEDWSLSELVKKIELTLRNGAKAVVTQENEGDPPKMKFKS